MNNEAFIAMVNKTELPWDEIQKLYSTPMPEIVPQDLSGKVVIITGANVGIGFETAKSLASMSPKKIILACRNLEKGNKALADIKAATGYEHAEVWELDLASFASVKAFASKFNATGLPLDILVSNAGIVSPAWILTNDGYEITTQVNHLSNVLLVLLLTPAIHKSTSARINVVASDTHFWTQLKQDDPTPLTTVLTQPTVPNPFITYPLTKLLNVLFAQEYARRNTNNHVWICSSNPGYTDTELGSKEPTTGAHKPRNHGGAPMAKRSTYEGAKTIIHASISPDVGKSGAFYSEMKDSKTNSVTHGAGGQALAERVWKQTVDILKPHLEEGGVLGEWVTK